MSFGLRAFLVLDVHHGIGSVTFARHDLLELLTLGTLERGCPCAVDGESRQHQREQSDSEQTKHWCLEPRIGRKFGADAECVDSYAYSVRHQLSAPI